MPHHLIREASFHVEEVLPFVPKSPHKRAFKVFAGHKISLSRRRYRLFAVKGTTCVCCGLKGTYMALERHAEQTSNTKNKLHFNVYGLNPEGEEVMITADHIIPRAKGGSNRLHNLQPMCEPCNVRKSDHMENPSCPTSSTTLDNSEKSTRKSESSKKSESSSSTSSSLPTQTSPSTCSSEDSQLTEVFQSQSAGT